MLQVVLNNCLKVRKSIKFVFERTLIKLPSSSDIISARPSKQNAQHALHRMDPVRPSLCAGAGGCALRWRQLHCHHRNQRVRVWFYAF